jgi:hypothetical protein
VRGFSDQDLFSVKFEVSVMINGVMQGLEFFAQTNCSVLANLWIGYGLICTAVDTLVKEQDLAWFSTGNARISSWS